MATESTTVVQVNTTLFASSRRVHLSQMSCEVRADVVSFAIAAPSSRSYILSFVILSFLSFSAPRCSLERAVNES